MDNKKDLNSFLRYILIEQDSFSFELFILFYLINND